jgi:acetyl-CoA synthetase (ADP-forming)
MMEKTAELVVGGKRDSQFGPIVMFGVEGDLPRTSQRRRLSAGPDFKRDSTEMLREIKWAGLLTGFRASERLDTTSVTRVIRIVGKIMTYNPEII